MDRDRTESQISAEAMERYRRTAQARSRERQERQVARQERAWQVARRAAALLKDEFGVTRVMAFGSLLQARLFHPRSDIDLAVWELDERDYLRALSRLLSLDPEISIDLVEFEYARPALQAAIQESGVVL